MLDVSPSVAKQFANNVEGAILVDKVVSAAQAELKKMQGEKLAALGKPVKIDQCVGASVRPNGDVMVRYFQIFSKSGDASTYSCNVSATAKVDGNTISFSKLSCAKDEGWGRTIDLI